ncbi:hypothetical protein EJF36_16330 [Bacillus sp. HMF5848]|uniref:hypothetical protein n=1 Tax=Bacillus sp. HMF5848 TaxID=2495421 RepID=UPI000F774911|nr:hypothetical protein [Bacillus sp. HMF5848]RSK28301.1 hypothetical protein EJF36_16330 [Bacillus sp. HMF5848]
MKKRINALLSLLTVIMVALIGLTLLSNQSEEVTNGLAQSSTSGEGQQEGIEVHGNWTIEILNEDGSIANKKSFENALAGGEKVIAEVLTRQSTPGSWSIWLSGTNGPCETDNGAPQPCSIYEPQLNITVPSSGENEDKIVLSGTTTAEIDHFINQVGTFIGTCGPDVAPEDCSSNPSSWFTRHYMDSSDSISVSAGQQVNVTVVLSFE